MRIPDSIKNMLIFAIPALIVIGIGSCTVYLTGQSETASATTIIDQPGDTSGEASPIQYSTIYRYAESGNPTEQRMSRVAFRDGTLTEDEYEAIILVRDDDEQRQYAADKKAALEKWGPTARAQR